MDSLSANNLPPLYSPPAYSHKGQNGRLLVIGGSQLFHASIFWSADIASRIVDLVHFSSPANENNDLVRQKLKTGFWNGIVVDWSDITGYIKEDDCILIGPGMPREDGEQPGDGDTSDITNQLLKQFPNKRWVIDGGALQEVDSQLLNGHMIISPHHAEWQRLLDKNPDCRSDSEEKSLIKYSGSHQNVTILLKGKFDYLCQGERLAKIEGGNPGMTKGGTGDVLAGLIAALYTKNESWTAAAWGSLINKTAADTLFKSVGPYFNSSDLVNQIPKVLRDYTQ